jgi:hypothetical protein
VGLLCISGVPSLGLPKMTTTAGLSSRPFAFAAAAWSTLATMAAPRFLIAASRRPTVAATS